MWIMLTFLCVYSATVWHFQTIIKSMDVRQMKNVHLVLFQLKIRGNWNWFKIDCLCKRAHDEWYNLEEKMNVGETKNIILPHFICHDAPWRWTNFAKYPEKSAVFLLRWQKHVRVSRARSRHFFCLFSVTVKFERKRRITLRFQGRCSLTIQAPFSPLCVETTWKLGEFPQRMDLQLYPHMINITQGGLCTGSSMSNYGPTVSDWEQTRCQRLPAPTRHTPMWVWGEVIVTQIFTIL